MLSMLLFWKFDLRIEIVPEIQDFIHTRIIAVFVGLSR